MLLVAFRFIFSLYFDFYLERIKYDIDKHNSDPNSSKAKPVNEERDISDEGVKDDDRTRGVWLQV